jgi:hypothetical protein
MKRSRSLLSGQLVSYLRSIVFGIVSGKRLIYRDFLEEGDRERIWSNV